MKYCLYDLAILIHSLQSAVEDDEDDLVEAMRSVRQGQEADDVRARSESMNDATDPVSEESFIPLRHSHTLVAEYGCGHNPRS